MVDTHTGRLWGGRFDAGPAEAMFTLSRSTDFDWRLARYDIAGSRAHARALHRAGLLTDDELAGMITGLNVLDAEVAEAEAMAFPDATPQILYEDIYVRGSEPQFIRGRTPDENYYY